MLESIRVLINSALKNCSDNPIPNVFHCFNAIIKDA